jgi:hypothetical protein
MFRILNTVPELNLLSRKMQTIIKDLISKDPAKRPDTIKNLAIIKEAFLSTNEMSSTKNNKSKSLNGLPYPKLPIVIAGLGILTILVLGFYFNPFKGIEEKTMSLSAIENEKINQGEVNSNNQSLNGINIIPSPSNIQSQTTSDNTNFVDELDDTKIAGNLILTTMPRKTYSYFQYTKNIIFFKQGNNEYNRIRTPYERYNLEGEWATPGARGTPLSNIDSRVIPSGQLIENISNLVSVDVNKGNGWERIKSEVVESYSDNLYDLDLIDFESIFLKNYTQKTKIEVRFNIVYEFGLTQDMLYFKNGDIHVHEIIPGTCKSLYNFQTDPPDNFKSNDRNNPDSDKKRTLYKQFIAKC